MNSTGAGVGVSVGVELGTGEGAGVGVDVVVGVTGRDALALPQAVIKTQSTDERSAIFFM